MFHEAGEHGEGFRPERDLSRTQPELRVGRVEPKVAEDKQRPLLHYQNITAT
jgi:hypothetical protein